MTAASSPRNFPADAEAGRPLRSLDYLRISVTDRCNEQCVYCLPEDFQKWTPREEILTYEEILAVVEAAVERDFKHFRVTGGEPLIRKDIVPFLAALIRMKGVQTVQITTNGTQLPLLARPLRNVGLNHLNISLDALDHQRYAEITHGSLAPVLAGIRMAKSLGFESIKLNTVLIRHKTEDQIWSLVEFAASLQIPIRFIELMPIGRPQMANEENLLSVGEVMQLLALKETLEPVEPPPGHGPARY